MALIPDERLVEAMAEAMDAADPGIDSDDSYAQEDHDEHLNYAAALLPAFLSDPRTAEWLAERLHARGYGCVWTVGHDEPSCTRRGHEEGAAAILGAEPGGAT